MRWDIGIDLGSESARVAQYKEGVTHTLSARAAFREDADTPFCVGDRAARVEARCGAGIRVDAPVKDGTAANSLCAERFLSRVFRDLPAADKLRRYGVMLTCAPFARPVQQAALLGAATEAGAAEAALVRSDAACAIGAEMDFFAPEAKLLVDLGAGKITATVFSLGRVVAFGELPYGMERIDRRIEALVRTNCGYRIGLRSARAVKHTLGSAPAEAAPKDLLMHMTGFSIETGMPGVFDVGAEIAVLACEGLVKQIEMLCADVISRVPEEVSADLNDTGAYLTGGGAQLSGLERRLGDALGIPCRAADAPELCAVRGLFAVMRAPEKYEHLFMDRAKRGGRL